MSHPVNEYIDDIPMRLDIRHQPLDFGVYLDEAAVYLPRHDPSSMVYTFERELEALENVNRMLEQQIVLTNQVNNRNDVTLSDSEAPLVDNEKQEMTTTTNPEPPPCSSSVPSFNTFGSLTHIPLDPTALPIAGGQVSEQISKRHQSLSDTQSKEDSSSDAATGVTSTKPNYSTVTAETGSSAPAAILVNPCDFEDINYTPFDHVELQTIDELQELNLIFQKSYSNGINNQDNR